PRRRGAGVGAGGAHEHGRLAVPRAQDGGEARPVRRPDPAPGLPPAELVARHRLAAQARVGAGGAPPADLRLTQAAWGGPARRPSGRTSPARGLPSPAPRLPSPAPRGTHVLHGPRD